MSKKSWIIMAAIVAAGLAYWGYHRYTDGAGAAKAAPLDTAVVKRGTLDVHVYATGNVQANRTVDIKCQAGGEITFLPFQVGDAVKQGQVVLEVDRTLEKQAKAIAEENLHQAQLTLKSAQLNYQIAQENLVTGTQTDQANVLSATAQVKNDQRNVQRDATLLKENLAARQTYDNDATTLVKDQQALRLAQVQIEQLKTQTLQVQLQKLAVEHDRVDVKIQQSNLDQANTNLGYCTVKAPITGRVANVDVQQGQVIASATTNVGGGTTVMTLVDTSHIYINATINESDINHVKIGDNVQITAAGAPGVIFPGRVVLLAPESIQDQNTSNVNATSNIVTFQAKIEVLGKHKEMLKPGMTANVNIFADRLRNVIYVPLQAIVIARHNDEVNVVKADGKQVARVVTLGQRNDTNWQVLAGLKPGEKVVLHMGNSSSMWTPHRR